MEISKDQFPIVIQAFEMTGNQDLFVAEQVVNNQAEVEKFSTRYAGKVIKARYLTAAESGREQTTSTTRKSPTGKSSARTIFLVILIILIILVAIGFYTGWIQRTLNMH